MFSHFEHTVTATISFLKFLGVRVNASTVNETLQNHPDYPSLLCISDSLQGWNIPNAAGKLQPEDMDQLPTPFIACTRDRDTPMAIVTQVTGTHIDYYSPQKRKAVRLGREAFLKTWAGVYLIAEATSESGEKDFGEHRRKGLSRSALPALLVLMVVLFSLERLMSVYSGAVGASLFIQYAAYVLGIGVTSLLLWYETDRNNPLLKIICTGLSKGSCETVLTSSKAKLFSWISWSEVGFFYFTGSLLTLLFVPEAANLLAIASLLAMPYILFSVYYQWRVVQRWCTLCLAVQALLLAGGVNTLAGGVNTLAGASIKPFGLSADVPLKGVSCFALPAVGWYSLKPYCLRLQRAVTLKREYLRLKFNSQLFGTLLKNQKQITAPVTSLGIDLGTPGAKNTLIKVCNPYCGPCATAHVKIEKLLEKHDNLQVKIIFTATTDTDDLRAQPVKHLMAITEKDDGSLTKKALDDWWRAEKRDYEIFATQYPMNGELLKQDHKLKAMSAWCKDMDIAATPTYFLNGYQLPDAYSVEDLEYFLLA